MNRRQVTVETMTMETKADKDPKRGRRRASRLLMPLALAALLAAALGASASAAAAGPLYDVKAVWADTSLPPGGEGTFELQARNLGDAAGSTDLTIRNELPEGVTAQNIRFPLLSDNAAPALCSGEGTATVECTVPGDWLPLVLQPPGPALGSAIGLRPSGYLAPLKFEVSVDPEAQGAGLNTATVSGGGAPAPATDVDQIAFSHTPSEPGFVPGGFYADVFEDAYPFGGLSRQAGTHPFEQRLDFDLTLESRVRAGNVANWWPSGAVKTVEVTLPRGMIGNPEAMPKCDPADFANAGAAENSSACPSNTQVGYLNIEHASSSPNDMLTRVGLYNLEPPRGTPVDLAFKAGGLVQAHIYAELDPAQNYAIKSVTPNISSFIPVRGSEVTLWGVPGDPVHDKFRWYPEVQPGTTENESGEIEEIRIGVGAPFGGAPIRPFFTNPMDCGFDNGGHRIRADFYERPGDFTPVEEHSEALNVEGCEDPRIRFEPQVSLRPTSRDAGGPTGLEVNLEVPQRDGTVSDASDLYDESGHVRAIATPPLKKVVVTLPDGMTANPAVAQGLTSCSPEQIGIDPATGVPNDNPVACPDASQYGTLTLKSPVLPREITGRVFIAQQENNPFGSLLALYLAIDDEDLGLRVKLAGKVDLDPHTGQITTTFDDLPQLPASEVTMSVKGGLRAGLVNPQTCGRKTIEATFYSWHDPNTPIPAESSYEITGGPGGTPCFNTLGERPFEPGFLAGTRNPVAGAFSPLELQLTRSDTDQDLAAAEGSPPPGLTASLRGIGRCSDAQIAQAAARSAPGQGALELASPSCPAESLVGTVDAGAGTGQVLTYVEGKVYLAGPYKGAPLSGVAVVPAVAGPFDLGTIVTRAPAYLDPRTAEITLKTDPLPQIVNGIPVRVRDIRVHLDREGFILNPTNCEAMSFSGTLWSAEGKSKQIAPRFQVGECASLPFKPRLSLRLFGGTRRGAHPGLRAVFAPRPGHANLRRAAVTLPRSAFLDQAHIRTICTRVQFAADACPEGSVYGHAVAHTPLLDEPLRGPVYLRSSSNLLPDMVLDLRGEIDVEAVARIDSVRGGIRSTFDFVPDAPVSKVVLRMAGGKRGLIVNSRNLCAGKPARARANLAAHSGRRATLRPKLKASCKKKGKRTKPSKKVRAKRAAPRAQRRIH